MTALWKLVPSSWLEEFKGFGSRKRSLESCGKGECFIGWGRGWLAACPIKKRDPPLLSISTIQTSLFLFAVLPLDMKEKAAEHRLKFIVWGRGS